jgi:hypothetical protein
MSHVGSAGRALCRASKQGTASVGAKNALTAEDSSAVRGKPVVESGRLGQLLHLGVLPGAGPWRLSGVSVTWGIGRRPTFSRMETVQRRRQRFVAESDPTHKDTMIRLVMNMLAQGTP